MTALDLLLEIEFVAAVKSMGLDYESPEALKTEDNAYKIINEIELLLLRGQSNRVVAGMCGLFWTHFGGQFDLLGQYIYSVMSRIGFSPVSTMLKSGSDKRIDAPSLLNMVEAELDSFTSSVRVFDSVYKLTGFQKRLWDAIESNSNIAVSAPTSAGKSFLICLSLLKAAQENSGISIYIVPNLSLMNQVANDLAIVARRHHVSVQIETHLVSRDDVHAPLIFVLTQERLADHSRLLGDDIAGVNYLVVDEVQNIERAFDYDDDSVRSKLLLDVIVDIHDRYAPAKTIISGPRISDIESMSKVLFEASCAAVETNGSPVANFCYSISPAGKSKIIVTQYSDLREKHRAVTVDNSIGACGFGKSLYNEEYYAYLNNILRRNEGGIVFSPTSGQCRKSALQIARSLRPIEDARGNSLAEYIRETVSTRYDLAGCVKRGVAFHHGKMPHHVRNAVEFAVGESMFKHVVCTTTLMQGVNIPAKSVVLRNPNLFVRSRNGERPTLSNYEIANLRGRAGRLLKDFVGRTFILDGTSFEEEQAQASLFEPAHKSIDGSYKKVFEANREEVIDAVLRGKASSSSSSLSTYISSVLYTEARAKSVLARRGIVLSDSEVAAVRHEQTELIVSKDTCKAHRYWNPFDLDLLQRNLRHFDLPQNPFSTSAKDRLAQAMLMVRELLPQQFKARVRAPIDTEEFVWIMAGLGVRWAAETPLREILGAGYPAESSENTDATIALLQNTISHDIPSVLSPVYTMAAPDSSMLSALESGACRASSLLLLANNIPRETALRITKDAERRGIEIRSKAHAVNFVKKFGLNYWDAIQFRHILSVSEIPTIQ